MSENSLYKDEVRDTHWIGEVVEIQDPLNEGRCKVKVFGKFDKLPTEAIPWATPMNRELPGAHAVPRVGDVVGIRFDNGNIYHPEYWFEVDQDPKLKDEVLSKSGQPFNVISIVYDRDRELRIWKDPEKGLIIDSDGDIYLGEDATERLVLGDTFMQFFNRHTHVGNLGAPTSPPNPEQMTPKQLSGFQHGRTKFTE